MQGEPLEQYIKRMISKFKLMTDEELNEERCRLEELANESRLRYEQCKEELTRRKNEDKD